jgi:site-specific DNA-methyltransferase (adenine-specific)
MSDKRNYESLSVEERFREAERARENDRGRRVSVLLKRGDARRLAWIEDESVHLIVTSPPYWTLKRYNDAPGQLGHLEDYEAFLDELDEVWRHSYRALVPGGRLCCVVGDVCLSRRKHGRHLVMPLHADISVHCRKLGFDNLNPIIWYKIANATTEVVGGGRFLGKPYEPNAVIKNDIEFILMQRKPGGYRKPTEQQRRLSMIERERFNRWFQQIWRLGGESTRNHPAPFPLQLADRLVRMFSFVGDTILDPFMGTGTTAVAAMKAGRNAVGVEIDPDYFDSSVKRVRSAADMLTNPEIEVQQ